MKGVWKLARSSGSHRQLGNPGWAILGLSREKVELFTKNGGSFLVSKYHQLQQAPY
jgi:predicted RNA binding protein YcfA (HicA-like mRNA interferase family)